MTVQGQKVICQGHKLRYHIFIKSVCQWKNFVNWLIFGKDMDYIPSTTFFGDTVHMFWHLTESEVNKLKIMQEENH